MAEKKDKEQEEEPQLYDVDIPSHTSTSDVLRQITMNQRIIVANQAILLTKVEEVLSKLVG